MKHSVIWAFAILLIFLSVPQFFADDTQFFSYYVTPDVWIILDTSGSMEWDMNGCYTWGDGDAVADKRGRDTDGDGIANDSRMYIVKQALYQMVNDPDIRLNWGLASFYQSEYNGSSDSHYRASSSYPAWWYCHYSPSNYYYPNIWWHSATRTYAYQAFLPHVQMAEGLPGSPHINEILRWVDCNSSSSAKKELRAQGGTPIAGALRGARYRYIEDIPSDNARWCRHYYVLLLTDGEPTYGIDQATYSQGKNAKWSSYNGSSPQWMKDQCKWEADSLMHSYIPPHGGDTAQVVQIKTYVIGVGNNVGASTLDSIAKRGGTHHYYPATDPSQLQAALEQIASEIMSEATSYSGAEVTSLQEEFITQSYEAKMYLCSFIPSGYPIWDGRLKAIKLAEGVYHIDSIPDSLVYWDAGEKLLATPAVNRNIYTEKNYIKIPFDIANITPSDLGVTTTGARDTIVNTIRSGSPTGTRGYLSDIFHSSPLRIHGPNYFYEDDDFHKYRLHQDSTRASMIYAGANDGMLHCFNDSTGDEEWAFIPNSQLPHLKTLLTEHRYFEDANAMAADIWVPNPVGTDSFKDEDEWRTVLIIGQRQGGRSYSALDITYPSDPSTPYFLFNFDTTMANLGETWSDAVMFKVHKNTLKKKDERFFGFVGGGYWSDSLYDIYNPGNSVPGNGIYALDILNMSLHHIPTLGVDYWKIPAAPGYEDSMVYPFPAQPAFLDTNLDTYADILYIGDVGGQLWKVVLNGDSSDVIVNNWRAKPLFIAPKPTQSSKDYLWQPIFFPATYAWDGRRWWLFFGTGDRANITKDNSVNRYYGIIDGDYTNPLKEDTLKRISSLGPLTEAEIQSHQYLGWYIVFTDFDNTDSMGVRDGEKVTSYGTVLMDTLIFTTFQPHDINDPCVSASGIARLYKMYYKTGSYNGNRPSTIVGTGVPQSPRYSFNISGSGLEIINLPGEVTVQQTPNIGIRRKLLWWHETH